MINSILPPCTCNKTAAMKLLKMSHGKFEKMGLVPLMTQVDPWGYGGVQYLYNTEVIEALASNPAEIERRLKAYKDGKAQEKHGAGGEPSLRFDW